MVTFEDAEYPHSLPDTKLYMDTKLRQDTNVSLGILDLHWMYQLRTGGFCWSRVLLSHVACPCWWQLARSDEVGDARVLLIGVASTISFTVIACLV